MADACTCDTPNEVAEQTSIFTRRGVERIARFAFELASRRPRKRLASATKSNAMQHTMVLWDEAVESVAAGYPTVEWRKYHVDALCARMVTDPASLDVILASNLFGDILTDVGAAVSGSLGVAPGANLNPERAYPSMFEPIHGSAPDIAGQGDRQPDRRDLGRRHDARPPGPQRRRTTGSSPPSNACSPAAARGRLISAARRRRER